MATPSLTDGQVSDMVKNYPAITVRAAQRAMERAGLDPSDPTLSMQMLGTDQFKKIASEAINARGDMNAISGQANRPVNLPDRTGPLPEREDALFQEQEDFQRGQSRSTGILATRIFEATQKASRLADFNETAFKTKRLKELNPTQDLDDQIMKLRFRQLTEEADIRSNPRFSHLSPAAKQKLIDTNRNENRETILGMREIRNARLSAAESRIDQEIASQNEIIDRAKRQVDDLTAAERMLEKSGESTEALFEIRTKRQKAERDRDKAKKIGGGDSQEETIYQLILEDLQRNNIVITGEIEKNAKIQAKQIARGITPGSSEGKINQLTAQSASLLSGQRIQPEIATGTKPNFRLDSAPKASARFARFSE